MNFYSKMSLRMKMILGFALPMLMIEGLSVPVNGSIGSLITTAGGAIEEWDEF